MKPRVKLMTLWVGETPPYMADFADRACSFKTVEWKPLLFKNVEAVNQVASIVLETPCRKESGLALSDLRPMLAELFPQRVDGYEWWGWVEVDVVLGDLDRLLKPLLDKNDTISMFPRTVSGPLMLFRNKPEVNQLFRQGNWRWVLNEPSYCNFEEVQGAHVAGFHKDGGITKLLRESGLRVHWDDRYSLRWEKDPAFTTPATCRLDGEKLIEEPTGRELMIYHFNHTKRWPL